MYMIYSFSAQDGQLSASVSYKASCFLVKAADQVFDMGLDDYQVSYYATKIHGVTRKLAHMTEYFLLAIAVSFPLYVYGLHGILLMLLAGGLCVAFACGDEYHQSFVSGRAASMKDVGIDSFGVFLGILIVRIVGWTGRMTIFRPIRPKDGTPKLSRKEKKRLKNLQAQQTPGSPDAYRQDGYFQNGPQSGYPGSGTYGFRDQNGYPGPYPAPEQNAYPPYQGPSFYGAPGQASYQGEPFPGAAGQMPYQGERFSELSGQMPYQVEDADSITGQYVYPGNPPYAFRGQGGFNGRPPQSSEDFRGAAPYGPAYPYQPQSPQYIGKMHSDESSDELADDMPLAHLLKPKKSKSPQ